MTSSSPVSVPTTALAPLPKPEPSSVQFVYSDRTDTLNILKTFSFEGASNVFHKAPSLLRKDVCPAAFKERIIFDVSMLHSSMFIRAERGKILDLPLFSVPVIVFVKQGVVRFSTNTIITENAAISGYFTGAIRPKIEPLCDSLLVLVPVLYPSLLAKFFNEIQFCQLSSAQKVPLSKSNWADFVRGLRATWHSAYEQWKGKMPEKEVETCVKLLFSTTLDKFPENCSILEQPVVSSNKRSFTAISEAKDKDTAVCEQLSVKNACNIDKKQKTRLREWRCTPIPKFDATCSTLTLRYFFYHLQCPNCRKPYNPDGADRSTWVRNGHAERVWFNHRLECRLLVCFLVRPCVKDCSGII